MSPTENSNAGPNGPVVEGGVLAVFPRTRPQRASARRAAARRAEGKSETAAAAVEQTKKARPAKAKAAKKSKPTPRPSTRGAPGRNAAKRSRPAKPTEPPAPRQGYEPEDDLELGNTVNPPNGVELLESLTDIVSELAGSSLTAGGRLLKDAFSVLRRT
jgi:hypothetical protein